MVHQFELRRVWEDDHMLEVALTLKGERCEATVTDYITEKDIESLIPLIKAFNKQNGKLSKIWILDGSFAYVAMAFKLANKRGAIRVNVSMKQMEQMEDDFDEMQASFSFMTTMGQLDDLSDQVTSFLRNETDLVESLRPE
ncbi:hypothetical protein [Exiguobacterium sp.]|uniref:hypothetical protein n=1 Tax=Exiguobacterium sp. TaxID=44751 RepID=UPI00263A97B7|nr:hypothetical protein [Exiguobacterium sp.]MCC5893352.1 hypothetical protein [Exiguobacterium sp.]